MSLWLWTFWTYSFLGYLLERGYAIATHADRQARKCFLLLPMCPVYGLGALAVLALSPGEESRPFLLLGSRAVLAASGPSAELSTQAERMRTWVALHPDDAAAWEALGQLEARLGRRLAAWRAQAEARFALGDWNGALEQLRAASRFARQSGQGDSIDAVVIDARLKVVDERRRRQLLEEGRNPDDPRENGSQR